MKLRRPRGAGGSRSGFRLAPAVPPGGCARAARGPKLLGTAAAGILGKPTRFPGQCRASLALPARRHAV